jgi:hypothetical protein
LIKKKLRSYQATDVERWNARLVDGFGIFHEQRVGKTLSALACINVEQPQRILIVTILKGVKVWEKEIRESLDVSDWWQYPTEDPPEIRIVNFNQTQDKKWFNRTKRWLNGGSSFMVVDESHRIKKRGSVWSTRCRALGRYADWRLALTGTPIAQGIQDAWAQFNFLEPSIFGKFAISKKTSRKGQGPKIEVVGGFQHQYLLMDDRHTTKVIGCQNEEQFYEIFHRHCVRKTLAEVRRDAGEKPARIVRRTLIGALSSLERTHYDELEAELSTVVNERRVDTPLMMTLSLKLQQICGGFLIDQEKLVHPIGNSKRILLHQALMSLDPFLDRPVVVCRYIHEMDIIEESLKHYGHTVKRIQGGVEFDPSQKILETSAILQIQSGVSIDLSFGTCLIFYSWNYSIIDFEQVRFRILQYITEKVLYIFLVMKDTVDELILEAVRSKKRFADVVLDHYRRRPN